MDEPKFKPLSDEEAVQYARETYCRNSDDNIEIDDDTIRLSRTDNGVWVNAWLWVPYEEEEAGKCRIQYEYYIKTCRQKSDRTIPSLPRAKKRSRDVCAQTKIK